MAGAAMAGGSHRYVSHRHQFRRGSYGIVAINANLPPLRCSTVRQSSSGSAAKTSSGSASTTIQAGSASSSSSWPGPQPE